MANSSSPIGSSIQPDGVAHIGDVRVGPHGLTAPATVGVVTGIDTGRIGPATAYATAAAPRYRDPVGSVRIDRDIMNRQLALEVRVNEETIQDAPAQLREALLSNRTSQAQKLRILADILDGGPRQMNVPNLQAARDNLTRAMLGARQHMAVQPQEEPRPAPTPDPLNTSERRLDLG